MAPGVSSNGVQISEPNLLKPPENAEEHAKAYWKTVLHGCQPGRFPFRPQTLAAVQQFTVEHQFALAHDYVSSSTLLIAAWAVVVGLHTNTSDVVFGAGLHRVNLDDEEDTPFNRTSADIVPVRIKVKSSLTLNIYIERVLHAITAGTQHSHLGLQAIRQIDKDTGNACDSDTVLVIAPSKPCAESPNQGLGNLNTTIGSDSLSNLTIFCTPGKGYTNLLAKCNTSFRPPWDVNKMLEQLAFVVGQLADAANSETLAQLATIPPSDIVQMWDWNKEVPHAVAGCVHHLIRQKAQEAPEAPAVCAWDGDFSYAALDRLSDQLTLELLRRGVGVGDLVPLCFEKSAWTVVAILAVLKAGGAFVLLDSSHPEERLRSIAQQTSSGLILTSNALDSLGRRLNKEVYVVGPDIHAWHSDPQENDLPDISPESTMYVVFTSGSTGIPKGVVVSHASFYSGLHHQLDRLGFRPGCRHYDFMAYSFDISIHNTIATLAVGGCLCIPSESDRRNNLRGSMLDMGATSTSLTPSVARVLGDDLLAALDSLVLIGEPVTLADTRRIWGKTKLINSYGPAECTPYSVTNELATNPETAVSIGTGAGALTWVVHPDDHNQLLPLGVVGELLLEGPILSQGYLNDPEKTDMAFIEDPPWLLQGSTQTQRPGRRGRLYKTGDLVRYNENGTLTFVGRKDTQCKIRGQRIELAEVEYHLREFMPGLRHVAVEIIRPGGQVAALAAFLVVDSDLDDHMAKSSSPEDTATVIAIPTATDDLLKKQVPGYMVPVIYFSLASLPLNRSGKVDRLKLRELGAKASAERQSKSEEGRSALVEDNLPLSDHERRLQQLWSNVLNVNIASISHKSNFFRLGGDSLSAMRLTSDARDSGLSLTVEDIFRHPDLGGLAEVSGDTDTRLNSSPDVPPFSLLGTHDTFAVCSDIAEMYGLDLAAIEDVYPCTPLQEGIFALSSKKTQREDYLLQAVLELADGVDLQRFQDSWDQTIEAVPILRTRIVEHGSHPGLLQMVHRGKAHWTASNHLDAYAIVRDAAQTYFVWTIHHAAYDGASVPLLREMVQQAYHGHELHKHGDFNLFVRHLVRQSDFDVSEDIFWQSAFAAYDSAPFHPYQPALKNRRCFLAETSSYSVTTATLIRAAWALVLYYNNAEEDVVFGTTVSGRNAPIDAIQSIIGPTIATLPTRVQIPDPDQTTVSDFLQHIQQQTAKTIPYEQTGLQKIKKFGREAELACGFQTLLVVQPSDAYGDTDSSLGVWKDMPHMKVFSTYALTLSCYLGADDSSIEVVANYDSDILQPWRLQKMLQLFAHLVEQLTLSPAKTLNTLEPLTPADRTQLWDWNRTVPEGSTGCVHDVIDAQARAKPDTTAIEAWDGLMTYRELDDFAAKLSFHLANRGIGRGSLVPLCFEKSKWAVVAILSVLRTGAGFVLMDPSQPEGRLRSIVQQLNAELILTSKTSYSVCKNIIDEPPIVATEDQLESLPGPGELDSLPQVDPSSTMYAVFTSGSTGNPKGVVIPHSSFRAALHHQLSRMGFTSATRHYDFLSYAFDASIWNTIATLAAGGCLCIPSEQDRRNNLQGSMRSFRVTSASLTPSVLGLLPEFPPSLQTVILLGEAVTVEHARLCWGKVAIAAMPEPGGRHPHWNRFGAVTWVADVRDSNRLAPIGAVGELLLEGPIVGNGYLHDAEKTKASFVTSPPWLVRGSSSAPGRHGRLYKTGDLVRYEPDGSLSYIGRKDTQVKVRGQRVELSEVEFHVGECVPSARQVAAEVVVVGEDSRPILVAFIVHDGEKEEVVNEHEVGKYSEPGSARFMTLQPEIEDNLARRLPNYMIPTLYFALGDHLPLNISGKTDRKKLRELGTRISADYLQSLESLSKQSGDAKPSTRMQLELQQLWATALHMEQASTIGLDENFFRLGGDSITAMKLVAEARRRNVDISVADIFRYPRLSSLAEVAKLSAARRPADVEYGAPFSLLEDVDIDALANAYGLDASLFEDAYPCTALQEGLFTLTSKRPGDYIQQCVFDLSADVDMDRFKSAWEKTVQSVLILRSTVMFSSRMLQVVLKKELEWIVSDDLQDYLKDDKLKPMELGDSLARFALVGRRHFVWTMHHSIYDNDSLRMIREITARHYRDLPPKSHLGFHHFLRQIAKQSEDETRDFWTAYLSDYETEAFPNVGGSSGGGRQEVHVNSSYTHPVDIPMHSSSTFTLATTIRAAWALTVHHQSGLEENDIVFGATVSGRNAPMAGIDRVIGPTIATVPLRVRVPDAQTAISDFLGVVQDIGAQMIPFEQRGLTDIAKLGPEAQRACDFNTLLVIQPSKTVSISTTAF
ncbi:peptide synthetase [Colletotrichum tofieldiae]|nr:peptide synthetase [Colletotrichum tofieldiae]